VRAVRDAFSHFFLRVHLHEGGRGLENARAAHDAGADALDAALLGLGGSPFAGEFVANLNRSFTRPGWSSSIARVSLRLK
jgi:isopropylmalate/homocitrate/citramalate synthase